MKIANFALAGLLLLGCGLTSCQNDYDAPALRVPVASLQPNTTLAEFKSIYADATAELVPLKDDETPYIIHGRVISSDASGNIYQSLVIQDETAALNLSIRRQNMWADYRVGQDVVINATGLYMGSYNGLLQLGGLGQYNGEPSMTFMSWEDFLAHSELNGLPDGNIQYVSINDTWPADHPYCVVTDIPELVALSGTSELGRNMMSQLVEIQNVTFEGAGVDTFADDKESNERRYMDDASNPTQRLATNNSGYANFHNDVLPEGVGTVRGILGYYQEAWQLTLRGIEDVLFNESGTQDDPYSVADVIAQNSNGRSAWVKGYIVGSAKAGVSTISSDADVIFDGEAETLNNLLIADSADETDISKCVSVSLPAGSKFRQYVNLVDNPEMRGQLLTLRGTFREFLGLPGITDNGGSLADFSVDGNDFSDALGAGTEQSPFQVEYFLQNAEPINDVWVTGYIVGYVEGREFETGAHFSLPEAGADYNGANVIVASSPDGANVSNSIPVSCDRKTIGLLKNPGNLGHKVVFKGNAGEFLGTFGISSTSSFVVE